MERKGEWRCEFLRWMRIELEIGIEIGTVMLTIGHVRFRGRNYTLPALDIDLDEARFCFETNVFSVMAMCKTFAPLLMKRKGLIVNIGSVAAVRLFSSRIPAPPVLPLTNPSVRPQILPYVFGSIYNASKAALHAYSRTLRLELAPFSVRVMVVVTGGVQSNIARTQRTLPPSSFYLEIEDEFRTRVVHSQAGAMRNEVYAQGVVDCVVRGGCRTLWRGNRSWIVWFVRGWLGGWVFDRVLPGMFGLRRLARMVKGREAVGRWRR